MEARRDKVDSEQAPTAEPEGPWPVAPADGAVDQEGAGECGGPLAALADAVPDVVCLKDGKGRWLFANRAALTLLGLEGHELVGRTDAEIARSCPDRVRALLDSAEEERQAWELRKPVHSEVQIHRRSGRERLISLTRVPLFTRDGARRGLAVIGRDVTEQRAAERRIHRLAHHDGLTGLANRLLFGERLMSTIAQNRRTDLMVAVLLVDLDRFKWVNDTFGHHVGDRLLREIGERLLRSVRESDTVARLGGDEFAIILTNLTEVDGAGSVAEAVLRGLAGPFEVEGASIQGGCSIGIAVHPADAQDPDQLLKHADLALYRSKSQCGNTYNFFVPEMNARVQARRALERDLRHAVARNEMVLRYQPMIDARSGQVRGVEALLRWDHPERGLLAPCEFLPLAETNDLAITLGEWVLRSACGQMKAWLREDAPAACVVAVNLSPAQVRRPDLVRMVLTVLGEVGLSPRHLQVEVTEAAFESDADMVRASLADLRAHGVRVALDDFGCGVSSIGRLGDCPADRVKIDAAALRRSFGASNALVTAIMGLGRSAGMAVDVESVETMDDLRLFRDHGASGLQGCLIAEPGEADAVSAWLQGDRSTFDLLDLLETE